jgi:hypothetical protein
MDTSTKSIPKSFLRGLASVLFGIAGLSFLVGGRAISEFVKVDRLLAELLGLGIAGSCLALGMMLKSAGEPDEVDEDPNSTSGNSHRRK